MNSATPKLVRQYTIVLCAALVLYIVSCAPGLLWQDSGLIQYRVWQNDIEGFLGLALSHPLFYILAIGVKYLPAGEFAYKVNLVSAIAAAVAVANVFLLVRLWLGRSFPAVIAAVTLALSHTFWRHACIAETYTLWTALFTGELIMLLRYIRTDRVHYLYALGFLNGLSIAVHILAVIPLACYAAWLLSVRSQKELYRRDLAIVVLLWIAGALPYEYLIVRNMIQTGEVAGVLSSAVFGRSWQGAVLNVSLSMKMAQENLLYILFNFPSPNILLFFAGCFGVFKLSRPGGLRRVALGLLVLFFVFAFRYTVPDRYAFFIPFYCMVAILTGVGTCWLQDWTNHKAVASLVLLFGVLPVGIYAVAPTVVKRAPLDIGTRNDIPYRDDYSYFLQPWKTGYRGAERFAGEALRQVANNAVIYADVTTVAPLLLEQQVEGKRPDVAIISGTVNSKGAPQFNEHTVAQLLEDRPIYVVSSRPRYCPAFVLREYDLVQAGVLWRLVERRRDSNRQISNEVKQ
ncbi:MAG TPA: DUF2723 domain-containing protein [Sedimentisphaerales bacterium]|nr:DUF2723 domain-containing protein [Sedimentisphaerales bacterium]